MFDGFTQAAPRFPERITVMTPKGTRSAIARAAHREKVTPAELLRRFLADKGRLESIGFETENEAPR
jgi:hypothetical protein